MSGSVTYTAWSQGRPELPSTNLLSLHSHPSLHRNANGIVSPVLLSCWAEDLACLSNFVLQSREPSTSRRARKLYTVVFTITLLNTTNMSLWKNSNLRISIPLRLLLSSLIVFFLSVYFFFAYGINVHLLSARGFGLL